jgi:hypothetical protein
MPSMPITAIGTATMTATMNMITTTKTTNIVKTTSNATTIIQHALSSKGKKATNNKKLLTTAAITPPTILSPTMHEIFALEEKCNINNNDQNIITKQDSVPEIAIGLLTDIVTK